ncbi:MAG TPA: type II toxin-antitoxin system death-on-curing family toxin [Noviherbaspirillum sp.]|nr:type II toxin-antitoxin system death-on-curing family toxin [Noviherbaspirillum sp.]
MSLCSVDSAAFLLLHRESLLEEGGEAGGISEEKLDAALAYPLREARLTIPDVAALAAAYAVGMLRYRPFANGNQRAALLALGLFLYSNDWRLEATQEEATAAIRRLDCGEMNEDELANWVRKNL